MLFRLPVLFAALLLLAGCGFQPLHGAQATGADGLSELQRISVAPIPERLGQLLRIELTNRLTPKGAPASPKYVLNVSITENKQELAVRKDATATRANLRFLASYSLTDAQTKQKIQSATVRSTVSYNILDQDFATLSAEADARRRAARDIAVEIRSRVGLFLAQASRS